MFVRTDNESCFQLIPASHLLQGVKNDTPNTLEISLERLVSLVDVFREWQCLPNISPGVLQNLVPEVRFQG